MKIDNISPHLRLSPEGIWSSAQRDRVSYPVDGHAGCYQIEDHSFWFGHRNDCIAAMVQRNPPPPGSFLDIGGGNGFVSQRLQAEGYDVVLLEPGPTGAANARLGRGLPVVICATVGDAGFKPESFAALGMFDVIEHIEDDRAFLAEASRLIPSGGMLYLTVPCHGWLWSRADVIAGHYRRHTYATLRTLLAPDFDIDYMSYFFQPLILPLLALRALPYRLGFQRRRGVLATETEHGAGDGILARMLGRMLRGEVAKVSTGKAMSFGASCLVAARKH
jgi:SAM-dependent methyltransferase